MSESSKALALAPSEKAVALLPSDAEWAKIKEIGNSAFRSGLLPTSIKNPEAAAIIALKGYECGMPPMVAFSHISVVQGKPTMSAEIQLAYVYKERPDADIEFEEMTAERCVIKARRSKDKKFSTFVWDMARAKRMGLADKDNWKKQPETMLKWRAITEMKRTLFAEVLMGIDHDPTELEDMRDVTPPQNRTPAPQAPASSDIQEIAKAVVIEDPPAATPTAAPVETPAAAPKSENVTPLKNYAPQTREEARNWRPGDSDPRKDQPKEPEILPPEDPPKPEGRSRYDIGTEIGQLCSQLKKEQGYVVKRVKKLFNKALNEVTNDEMEHLCLLLKAEVANVQQ